LGKWLKALILNRSGEFPPRIHQLIHLAEAAGAPVDEEQADFFRELSFYYIQSRYPDDIPDPASISKELALRVLNTTKEMISWLETLY
jgi:HEPN domain-containing protein